MSSSKALIDQDLYVDKLDRNAAAALQWSQVSKSTPRCDSIQQAQSMSSNLKFAVFYLGLIIATAGLIAAASHFPVLETPLSNFWGVYVVSQCWALMLAGVGLMLPVGVIAFGFGWLQLYLIINGQIDPHLAAEGFGSALRTIFSKVL